MLISRLREITYKMSLKNKLSQETTFHKNPTSTEKRFWGLTFFRCTFFNRPKWDQHTILGLTSIWPISRKEKNSSRRDFWNFGTRKYEIRNTKAENNIRSIYNFSIGIPVTIQQLMNYWEFQNEGENHYILRNMNSTNSMVYMYCT
jgi:hypothetical protein